MISYKINLQFFRKLVHSLKGCKRFIISLYKFKNDLGDIFEWKKKGRLID